MVVVMMAETLLVKAVLNRFERSSNSSGRTRRDNHTKLKDMMMKKKKVMECSLLLLLYLSIDILTRCV